MESFGFNDGNINNLLDIRHLGFRHDINRNLQSHSSLIEKLSLEYELEGHDGCVNSIAWNSKGSLLISGSDDTRANIWSYPGKKLIHSIDTGHSTNIFCTKFLPETSDEIVASGAGDAEVRLFNLSCSSSRGFNTNDDALSAIFQCHSNRVKKLAVEVGNPNVVWSASEDGTVRQHDLREGTTCPPTETSHRECRNVLLDLRCGTKSSLADPPKHKLAIKSFDISTTRPHLLIVGGSDAFARLYDRRMLPPMSSCRKRTSPPPSVNYFCPIHLSDHGHSGFHLTHVTFSSNGEEALISYNNEHAYLFNVDNAGGSITQYTSGDASKLISLNPPCNKLERHDGVSNILRNDLPIIRAVIPKDDKIRKLLQNAEKSLREGTNYFYGIEACNEILDARGYEIEDALRYHCLCSRAGLLLLRKWKNDVHMAIRDCYNARKIDNSCFRAFHLTSEALSQLEKHEEALEFAIAAQQISPSNPLVGKRVEEVKKLLAKVEADKTKASGGAEILKSKYGQVLSVSVSDRLYRSEGNSDTSDTENSDYDEEMELEFETSLPEDEGLHGNLNFRIQRTDSARESSDTNGSCESSSSSEFKASYQPEAAIDMKQRFIGHQNLGTDIKQASFLGIKGEFVASGSDDGRWFIWKKDTGRLVKMLIGDLNIVNCVQSHPFDCVVATSGIDSTIKIWSPTASIPSIVASGAAGPETRNALNLNAVEINQRRLALRYPEALLPISFLEQFQVPEVDGNGRLECNPS